MEKISVGGDRLTIRSARREDAEFVAWTVLTALDMDNQYMEEVTESCADEKSMYSWKNSIIACADDEPVGCLVSYEGDKYEELREYTWSNLWKDADEDFIRNTPLETYPGEYYLDSMAIKPEYRGLGIGKLLIDKGIEKGKEAGYTKFGLIVDINKPRLKKHYETAGFKEAGKMMFFGHEYDIMRRADG